MIIVSQDRQVIMNFKNIIGIQRDDNCIGAIFVHGDSITFGEYKTEERAKEVLQEMIDAIQGKSSTIMTQESITLEVAREVYEMPLE